MEKYAKAKQETINTCRKKVALKIYESVVMKTPVKTGRARANWQITIGRPAKSQVKGNDPSPYGSPPRNLPQQAEKLGAMKNSDATIYISNNLPYIVGLEYGKSQQSPSGMVGVTIAEMNRIIEESVAESKEENK